MMPTVPVPAPAATTAPAAGAVDEKKRRLLEAMLKGQSGSTQAASASPWGAAMQAGAGALNAYSASKMFGGQGAAPAASPGVWTQLSGLFK